MTCACEEIKLVQFSKAAGGRGQDTVFEYRLPPHVARLHDCAYVAARSALVPLAEAWANEVIGEVDDARNPDKVVEWNLEFDAEMRRLVQRNLLAGRR